MKLTGNAITLLVNIFLFSTITSAQIVFALLTGSQALLVDAMSMIVDVLTYVGNLIAECCGKAKGNVECKLVASAISLVVLLGISFYGLVGSSQTVFDFWFPPAETPRVCGNIGLVAQCGVGVVCNAETSMDCCACGGGILRIDDDQYYLNNLGEVFNSTTTPDFSGQLNYAINASVAVQNKLVSAQKFFDSLSFDDAETVLQEGLLIDPNAKDLLKLHSEVKVSQGFVVLTFSIFGLVVDILSFVGFELCKGKREGACICIQSHDRYHLDEDTDGKVEGDNESSVEYKALDDEDAAESSSKSNMISACLHMSADCLRSTTTLVESIIVLSNRSIEFDVIDGFAAVVICLTIIAGSIVPIIQWIKTVSKVINVKKKQQEDDSTSSLLNKDTT